MSLNKEEETIPWKGWSTRKEEKGEGKPVEGEESIERCWSRQKRQRDTICQNHGGSHMPEKRYLQYFHIGREQLFEQLVIPSQQNRPVGKRVSEAWKE